MTAKDSHGTNSKRLAEVWLDEYKRLYYHHRPDLVVSWNHQFPICIHWFWIQLETNSLLILNGIKSFCFQNRCILFRNQLVYYNPDVSTTTIACFSLWWLWFLSCLVNCVAEEKECLGCARVTNCMCLHLRLQLVPFLLISLCFLYLSTPWICYFLSQWLWTHIILFKSNKLVGLSLDKEFGKSLKRFRFVSLYFNS